MIGLLEAWARPLLRLLDPEDAHRLAIQALKLPPYVKLAPRRSAARGAGLRAEFPQSGRHGGGLRQARRGARRAARLGFGFVEIGTVTPQPQPGNPRPRVFRLDADEGVINRLGFNSEGAEAVLRRLAARADRGGIVGVNVGANKDAADRIADYVRLIETFAPVASYFTVNISSPNTPGLRDLQQGKMFDDLLARVIDARERMSRAAGTTPVLIKIAPDLTLSELDDIVGGARRHRVDGMIVGNTTISRPPGLRDPRRRSEPGGLSGRPLFALATRMLAETYVRVEGAFPLIGVGGIDSGDGGARQDQGGRVARAALQRAGLPRAAAGRRDQGRALGGARAAAATPASTNWSAPTPPR